jgi:hypothetical protein
MNPRLATTLLLVVAATLPGCKRSLDERDVRMFVDRADAAARARFAPDICALRGETFTQELTYQSIDDVPPSSMTIDRKLYCREAGRFSKLRQYRLERRSLTVDVAEDAKSAKVVAEYVETLPYYESEMPATPDDFRNFVIVESHDESTVGIEDGDLVFLSAKVSAEQTELVSKSKLDLPYD